MKNIQNIVIGALIVVVAVLGYQVYQKDTFVGAAGGMLAEAYWPYLMYNDGYKSEKEISLSGANGDITTGDDLIVTDDATVSGGNLTVTTSNTATSTTAVGCIQGTATSTATPIKYVLTDTGTTTKAGPNGTTANGFVLWQYGTCP